MAYGQFCNEYSIGNVDDMLLSMEAFARVSDERKIDENFSD